MIYVCKYLCHKCVVACGTLNNHELRGLILCLCKCPETNIHIVY